MAVKMSVAVHPGEYIAEELGERACLPTSFDLRCGGFAELKLGRSAVRPRLTTISRPRSGSLSQVSGQAEVRGYAPTSWQK